MFEIQGNNHLSKEMVKTGSRNMENSKEPTSGTIAYHASVLSGMSHELRTQMNAIVSFAFLLKNNHVSNTEKEEFINQIYLTCENVIALFENYLESALAETGNQDIAPESCNISSLTEYLLSEFREILKKGDKKDIELVSETQYAGSQDVIFDKTRVYRILKCLFQNSIQNTSSGYIKIGYYLGNSEITFYVLDSGQGYLKTREFLHTKDLTESLSQYNDLSSAINISLAKKLIELLKGSYSIRCNGTNGSGVYFSIPATIGKKQKSLLHKFMNSMISF